MVAEAVQRKAIKLGKLFFIGTCFLYVRLVSKCYPTVCVCVCVCVLNFKNVQNETMYVHVSHGAYSRSCCGLNDGFVMFTVWLFGFLSSGVVSTVNWQF